MSTFPGEERLRHELRPNLCHPIFNTAVEVVASFENYNGVAKYISTKELLMDHLKTENCMKYSKAPAAMYVLLKMLVAALRQEDQYSDKLEGPKTGGLHSFRVNSALLKRAKTTLSILKMATRDIRCWLQEHNTGLFAFIKEHISLCAIL